MKNQQSGEKSHEITWQELKDFVNSLTDSELQQKVLTQVSDDEYRKYMNEPFREEEDIYIHDPSEEIAPIKEMKEMFKGDDDFKESDCRLICPKGTPFLWID